MFNQIINFFSKFSSYQLLAIGIVVGVVGYLLYYFISSKINELCYNKYYQDSVKNNFNKALHFINKNADCIPDNKYINSTSKSILNEYLITSSDKDHYKIRKYQGYINEEFILKNKLNKIIEYNYEKNKHLKTKELVVRCLKKISDTYDFNVSRVSFKGGVLTNLKNHNMFYVDIYIDTHPKHGIGIIFSPFYKVFYPNTFFPDEESFSEYRSSFISQIEEIKENHGVFIIEVPEKIYNLDFDEDTFTWDYKENVTPSQEEFILNNEDEYMKYFTDYFQKTLKANNYKDFVLKQLNDITAVHPQVFI